MSFSWSASSSPSFVGMKPSATNSFADALKRLAEHVEEKNKNTDANNGGASSFIQSPTDIQNRMISANVNNSMSSEQALRLYTQYIQEAERGDDMRRCYLRAYSGSDGPNINSPTLNRRLNINDSYRFMAPHLSSLLYPSTYVQSLAQQTRLPPPSPFSLPNLKTTDTTSRIPTQESNVKKPEISSKISKPKLKLFRPYDLDSPNTNSRQTSPCSPTTTKKSTPSPTSLSNSSSSGTDEQQTTSSGREKQLFNSLGLVQQSTDIISENISSIQDLSQTSPSIATSEDSTSVEMISIKKDEHLDKSISNTTNVTSSVTLKRKSAFSSNTKKSSNRKQSKTITTTQ